MAAINKIMIQFVSRVQRDLPAIILQLQKTGFPGDPERPETPLGELNKKLHNLRTRVHHSLWQIYKIAKYEAKQ